MKISSKQILFIEKRKRENISFNFYFIYYELDVDEESFDLFCKMKRLRITSGIPVLMVYYPANCSINPDDICIGADISKIKGLFERIRGCLL